MLDLLIVGQGICGTWLSYFAEKANLSFQVIDDDRPFSSSKIASGVINPVTGRRMVQTWLADELHAFNTAAYADFDASRSIQSMQQKDIINFFSAPDMAAKFESLLTENNPYCEAVVDETLYKQNFNYIFGIGITKPCFLVDVRSQLNAQKMHLLQATKYQNEKFDFALLKEMEEGIVYKNWTARKIVFTDGVNGQQIPLFKNLPYAVTKGEALIVQIKDLPTDYMYKKTLSIVPWKTDENLFWVGSGFDRDFGDDQPSMHFKNETIHRLKQWLQLPFEVVDHLSSLRPTTVERRPFVGFHPQHKHIGVLNGMGSKGCSLAPYFAKQLTDHLANGDAIMPDVDVQRFAKVLARE
jgi:glycine/D-amino acid oxidase-like deaminating enzyme